MAGEEGGVEGGVGGEWQVNTAMPLGTLTSLGKEQQSGAGEPSRMQQQL